MKNAKPTTDDRSMKGTEEIGRFEQLSVISFPLAL
jgi:hypothetical protein